MRIVIAEGQQLMADALCGYLKQRIPNAEVTMAGTLDETLQRVGSEEAAELLLIDLDTPGMERLKGVNILRSRFPHIPIVIMCGISDDNLVKEALKQGASGFVLKQISGEAMVKVLELVLAGETYIPSQTLSRMCQPGGTVAAAPGNSSRTFERLTGREREVLELLRQGCSNKKIAEKLGVKEITAAFHVGGLLKKLGASNRTQAATIAIQYGWGAG